MLRHSRACRSKCPLLNLWELLKSRFPCTSTAAPPWFWPSYRVRLSLHGFSTHVILTESSFVPPASSQFLSAMSHVAHSFGHTRNSQVLTVFWAGRYIHWTPLEHISPKPLCASSLCKSFASSYAFIGDPFILFSCIGS